MAPIKQRAAYVSESGLTFGLVDVPKPGPGQILVKVVAAAQNPTDCRFYFPPAVLKRKLTDIYPALRMRILCFKKLSREDSRTHAQAGKVWRDRGRRFRGRC